MPATRRDVAATHRYGARYTQLRLRSIQQGDQLWRRFGGVTQANERRFVAAAIAAAAGGERAVAALVGGYVSLFDSTTTIRPRTGAEIRGVDPVDLFARPVVTARFALSEGKPFAEAMNLARIRTKDLFGTGAVLSQRDAMDQALSKRIVGYRRVLTGSSCALCAAASARRYKSSDLMPIHDHCDCFVAPIIGDRDPGQVINRDLLADLKRAGGPDYWEDRGITVENGVVTKDDQPLRTAIHEHGELGPVLTVAGQHFKTT